MTKLEPAEWTARERLLLTSLADGATATAIAATDRLPVPQVRSEVRALRTRLGARTNVHLVAEAVRGGVI